jgi:hypothetical protein
VGTPKSCEEDGASSRLSGYLAKQDQGLYGDTGDWGQRSMRPSPQPGEPGEGRGVTFGQLTTKGKDPRTVPGIRGVEACLVVE